MTTFDPREGAVERWQRVDDFIEDGPQSEAQAAVLDGLSLVNALELAEWLGRVIIPRLKDGYATLALEGYVRESAEAQAFLGPEGCLSISLSGVRFQAPPLRLPATADATVLPDDGAQGVKDAKRFVQSNVEPVEASPCRCIYCAQARKNMEALRDIKASDIQDGGQYDG